MPQNRFRRNSRAALLAAIAVAYPVMGHSAPAARVDFAVGNVTAVTASGQSRALAKGAQLDEGETINTNNGRAQLRFTDGAYVSLQPESQFRIDQYRFEGKVDGSEKGLFSLLKGGLRTITGLVGRNNRKNYQISTTVATMGIRGTEYTIQYGKSISGTVGEGEIEVCNGAGCLSVTNGESYYVQNQDLKPVLTDKRTDLPPAPPQNPPASFAEGEHVGQSGDPCTLFPDKCQPSAGLTGTQTLDTLNIGFCVSAGPCTARAVAARVVFDGKGTLLDFGGGPVTAQMSGNDGIVAWGTFTDSSSLLTHFLAGLPVPSADLSALGGTTGTYSLIGSTPVTDSSNQAVGTLNGATLAVNFGFSTPASADMIWTIDGLPLSANLIGTVSESSILMSGPCGASCLVSADVLLFGPNAVRAGMVYDINRSRIGAAAFAKQ